MTATVKGLVNQYWQAEADRVEWQHRADEAVQLKTVAVRRLRDCGLTQREVGDLLGVTDRRIGQLEART